MSEITHRVLRLLGLLESRSTWTGSGLAERLGVTQRTVRRDVIRLRERLTSHQDLIVLTHSVATPLREVVYINHHNLIAKQNSEVKVVPHDETSVLVDLLLTRVRDENRLNDNSIRFLVCPLFEELGELLLHFQQFLRLG